MSLKIQGRIGQVTARATAKRQAVSLHLGRVTLTRASDGSQGVSVRLFAGLSWFKWWKK